MESCGVTKILSNRGIAHNVHKLNGLWSGRPDSNRRRPAWKAGIFSRLTVISGTSDITSTYSKEGSGRRRLRLPRLGPHSLRRANINMAAGSRRQQPETSKIAGHANTKITEEYTIVQMNFCWCVARHSARHSAKPVSLGKHGSANGSRTRWLAALAGPFQSKWRVFSAGCTAELAKHPPRMAVVLDACWTDACFPAHETARETAQAPGAQMWPGASGAARW